MQRTQHGLRLSVDKIKEHPGGALRMPAPLLPVLHGCRAYAEGGGKTVLTEPELLARLGHVNRRHFYDARLAAGGIAGGRALAGAIASCCTSSA